MQYGRRLAAFASLALIVAACGGGSGNGNNDPDPTERVTDAPEITIPPGLGEVNFGLDYDPDTLEIVSPTTRFKTTYPAIAYSAQLSEEAGAATLRFVVASVSAGGAEVVLLDEEVPVSNPTFSLFANKLDLATLVGNAPGDYVVRYLRDATILAEGTFTLVAP